MRKGALLHGQNLPRVPYKYFESSSNGNHLKKTIVCQGVGLADTLRAIAQERDAEALTFEGENYS